MVTLELFKHVVRHLLLDRSHSVSNKTIFFSSFETNLDEALKWIYWYVGVTLRLFERKLHAVVFVIRVIGHVEVDFGYLESAFLFVQAHGQFRGLLLGGHPRIFVEIQHRVDLELFVEDRGVLILGEDLILRFGLLLATGPDNPQVRALLHFQRNRFYVDINDDLLLGQQVFSYG